MPITRDEAARKRDAKLRATLIHLAPIWMVHDEYRPREDSMLFNVVMVNPVYGWVNKRFKYDAYNDVLYAMGEKRLTETEALPIQDQEPYLVGEVATQVPNTPSYRASPPLQG